MGEGLGVINCTKNSLKAFRGGITGKTLLLVQSSREAGRHGLGVPRRDLPFLGERGWPSPP